MSQYPIKFIWAPKHEKGFECSSHGDQRFSAMWARMPDGRTIEMWYQCDVKGYAPGGTYWKVGKGKPPAIEYLPGQLYQAYLGLWRIWAVHNPNLMNALFNAAREHRVLTDRFAKEGANSVNQARALAQILNEWVVPAFNEGV